MSLTDITFADILGIIGSLMIMAAYLGVSMRKMDGDGVRFQLLNLVGSLLLLVSLISRPNAGALLLEGVWALIAAVMLVRIFLRWRGTK